MTTQTEKNGNGLQINKININKRERESLIIFYAITENNYILPLFGNPFKCKCWKKMMSKNFFNGKFFNGKCLGNSWNVPETLFIVTEEYICAIYNAKYKTVKAARAEIFKKKYANENKTIYFSSFLPYKSTFVLHVKHANYAVKIYVWKICSGLDFNPSNIYKLCFSKNVSCMFQENRK